MTTVEQSTRARPAYREVEIDVEVRRREAVADGDALVLLESMKMEIPVLTETAGTISSVVVSSGDVVQEGDLIMVIE